MPAKSKKPLARMLVLVLAGLGGCDRGSKPEAAGCDQAKIAALAAELDAAAPDQRIMLVREGLLGACEGSLSATAEFALDVRRDPSHPPPMKDEAFAAARERICPNYAELHERLDTATSGDRALIHYEVCGLARYDLLDEAALRDAGPFVFWVTWTTHDLLLSQGTPVEVAKTISRALFSVELQISEPVPIHRLPGQALVAADVTTPIPHGVVVQISATELLFNERLIASLEVGKLRPEQVERHVVLPLFEALEEEVEKIKLVYETSGEEWDATLIVAADRRVTFATLVDTTYTASRVGFTRFAFVVERTHPIVRTIIVTPPRSELDLLAPTFTAFIADDGYHVHDQAGERVTLAKLDPSGTGPSAWDQAKLVDAARAAVAANPEIVRAVVSAENNVSTDVLLATYAALLGPGCNQIERTNCLLPDLTLLHRRQAVGDGGDDVGGPG